MHIELDSRQRLESLLPTSITCPGPTRPLIHLEPGALLQEVKRPGREADHSLPFSPEVKNEWSYTSPQLYVSMMSMVIIFL